MKSASTIRQQIRNLQRTTESEAFSDETRNEAYEAHHALLWVLGEMHSTPTHLIAGRGWRDEILEFEETNAAWSDA